MTSLLQEERQRENFPSATLSPFLGLTNDRIIAALLLLRSSIQPGNQAGEQDWVEAKNKISAIELKILNLNWGPSFYMDRQICKQSLSIIVCLVFVVSLFVCFFCPPFVTSKSNMASGNETAPFSFQASFLITTGVGWNRRTTRER